MSRILNRVLIVIAVLVAVLIVISIRAIKPAAPEQIAKIAAASAQRQQVRAAEDKKEAADKQHYRARHGEVGAFIAAKDYVSVRLKSPASAKFASSSDSTIVNQGDGKYLVRSFVDSQNAFGAMMRTNYICEMITSDGEKFIVTEFTK